MALMQTKEKPKQTHKKKKTVRKVLFSSPLIFVGNFASDILLGLFCFVSFALHLIAVLLVAVSIIVAIGDWRWAMGNGQ